MQKERKDYTQLLFNKFMRKSQVEPYRCMCYGSTILTTDPKLYNKLKEINGEMKKLRRHCSNSLEEVGFKIPKNTRLTENTQLPEEATYALLFKSEEIIDGTSEKTIGGESTCVLSSNQSAFDRFTNLIPLIVNHHINECGIDTEKYDIRVPALCIDLSVNNQPVKLQFGGTYLYTHDFKYAATLLNAEMDKMKADNKKSEVENNL